MIGGGSIFAPVYFGDHYTRVSTPMYKSFSALKSMLQKEYMNNNKAAGGYFILRNLQFNNENEN